MVSLAPLARHISNQPSHASFGTQSGISTAAARARFFGEDVVFEEELVVLGSLPDTVSGVG